MRPSSSVGRTADKEAPQSAHLVIRMTYQGWARHRRALQSQWYRQRRRSTPKRCENCGWLMPLKYVGPQRFSMFGRWRRLSNRIFCDTCICEREKARRDEMHRSQYTPLRMRQMRAA